MTIPDLLMSSYPGAEEAARELVGLALFEPNANEAVDYMRVVEDLARVDHDGYAKALKALDGVDFTKEQEELLEELERAAEDRSATLIDVAFCLGLAVAQVVDIAAVLGRRKPGSR